MPRARFTGPPNPDPEGRELGHSVPLAARVVMPDEVVDLPGQLLEELPDAYLCGDPGDESGRYVLPKALWRVEDEPARRPAKVKE